MDNTVSKIWQVAVHGLGSFGLDCLERLSLRGDVQVTLAFDADAHQRHRAEGLAIQTASPPGSPVQSDDVDVLFLTEDVSFQALKALIGTGRHVVLHRPWLLTSIELKELHDLAATTTSVVTIAPIRRWSADFQAAISARRTGRIGLMKSLKFASCVKRIPEEKCATSVLREFGYQWLDQSIILADAIPTRVFGKQVARADTSIDDRFLAIIDFANGCDAQIEVDTNSRIGYRMGWILEGQSGSYRANRLYTETSDGEIVDEPIPATCFLSDDPWIDLLVAAWSGTMTTLPALADAAQIVRLIEAIEESVRTGLVVTL